MASFIQSFDIETTGARLGRGGTHDGRDVVFAIGSAVLRVATDGASPPTVVESRRWVLKIGRDGQSWADAWKLHGWEQSCWDQFWHKHAPVLDALMTTPPADMYATEADMAASLNRYLEETESKYRMPRLTRVYDTVGFDVSNLDAMLERHGHRAVFLWRPPQDWPCNTSYLGDVRDHALGVNPLTGATDDQKQMRKLEDARALPADVVHTHDPAQDALSIVYKWVHYARMAAHKQ